MSRKTRILHLDLWSELGRFCIYFIRYNLISEYPFHQDIVIISNTELSTDWEYNWEYNFSTCIESICGF